MGIIKEDDSINEASIIEELKSFEESKETELLKQQQASESKVQNAKKRFERMLSDENSLFEKKRASMIKKTEEDVEKEAKLLAKEHEQLKKMLEKSFSTKFNSAVEAAISELLK